MSFICPFCKSTELKIKRITQFGPEVKLGDDGKDHPVEDFCCQAQRQNHKYVASAFAPDDRPDMEEVSKW